MSGFRLSLDDVRRARETLAPAPATDAAAPKPRGGAGGSSELLLKLECWQPTGSFKVRGATCLLSSLSEDERRRGVVAASAGNHALGVAFAAERLGGALRTTLFVPRTAPRSKVRKLERFPVDVREAGDTYDDAVEAAQAFERETGAVFVHAFEDARTAAGQGTIGLEVMEERPDVAAVVVPVGGGGLVAGVATAVKALAPGVRIVAVQPEASPSLRESIRLGRPLLTYPAAPTLADGLSGGIGHVAFDHRDLVDEIVTVSEPEIEDAIVALVASDQVVAEASGAVGVAALRAGRVAAAAHGPVAVVVTGGNLDAPVLARLMAARYPGAAS